MVARPGKRDCIGCDCRWRTSSGHQISAGRPLTNTENSPRSAVRRTEKPEPCFWLDGAESWPASETARQLHSQKN